MQMIPIQIQGEYISMRDRNKQQSRKNWSETIKANEKTADCRKVLV